MAQYDVCFSMDWTDHGSVVVPELDWASISGVTMSASLRPDYIAEARYDLGSLALAPGAEVQLNTRLRLKDWSSDKPNERGPKRNVPKCWNVGMKPWPDSI